MFKSDCWKRFAKPRRRVLPRHGGGWHLVTSMLLGSALSGCAWGGSPVPETPPEATAPPVEMVSGGLLASQSGKPELGLILVNHSDRALWVRVRFRTPNGLHDCVLTKELEPKARGDYICRQSAIQADVDYPVQILVFSDIAQAQVLDRLNTRFRFDKEDVRAAQGKR
jgi:hypothetical protein